MLPSSLPDEDSAASSDYSDSSSPHDSTAATAAGFEFADEDEELDDLPVAGADDDESELS